MKYLLLLLLSVFSFTSNAQFVTQVYDAQKAAMNGEQMAGSLMLEMKKVGWAISIEEIYIMPEGKLNIPMIEIYFGVRDTTNTEFTTFSPENSIPVVMYMFDKSEKDRVKVFFEEMVEPEQPIVYFETTGTFSCMYRESEEKLEPKDKVKYQELQEALKAFFKKHYNEL